MKKAILLFSLSILPIYSYGWSGSDFTAELSSPWTTKAKKVVVAGAAVTLISLVIEDSIDRGQDEVVEDKPLGDFSRYGDWAGQLVPNIAYILGQSAFAFSGDKLAQERAIGMFKATAYAAGLTTALKYTIAEPRPDNHRERNSFPSGHTTTAFAFGGYVLAEHGWKWGVPALMVSTLSGLSRVNDNRHRLQDVFAGLTIGLGYGMGISYLQKKRSGLVSYHIVPVLDHEVKGLVLCKDF